MTRILITVLAISLSGCAMNNLKVYKQIDTSDKSITVPPGSNGLKGDLKEILIQNGWRLVVDRGPSFSEDVSDVKSAKVKHFDTFNTRYRLLVNWRQYDICMNFSPAINYDISLIDNKSGDEVFTLSGNSCQNFVIDKFVSALESKTE